MPAGIYVGGKQVMDVAVRNEYALQAWLGDQLLWERDTTPPPDGVGFITSISVLSMVAVGGIGSVYGVILGTTLLTLMPDIFRFISDYKLFVYGALLFAVMRFAPEGLAGLPAMVFAKSGARTGDDP